MIDVLVFVVFFVVATIALSFVYGALFSTFYPLVDHAAPGLSSIFVIAAAVTAALIYFIARLLFRSKSESKSP